MTPLLEIRGINKSFTATLALDNISLQFFPGEIHAIVGENGAGKSTLLNILTGSLLPDAGSIYLQDRKISFRSPKEARIAGISIVYQELSLFPEITVLENVFAGITPQRLGFQNKRQMKEMADYYFKRFNVDFGYDNLLRDLSVSQQQIVEIIKALIKQADVYIFDEPTASLSDMDAEKLFIILNELKQQGKAIIYVSHKFNEIFRISDRISILRDGCLISTAKTADLDPPSVVRMMVGRSLDRIYPEKGHVFREEKLFCAKGLNAGGKCKNVSFDLYRGEILGVFGLVGSFRTEIMRALTGIDQRETGTFELKGRRVLLGSIQESIADGIYYLTEDRKQQGLFLKMTVGDNIAVTDLPAVAHMGMVKKVKVDESAAKVITRLRVKTPSAAQLVGSLSGGNQQKVMIGKWVVLNPRVIILDEPTRGIDVGAKAEIHQLLRDLANQGVGVIMISSELPEIVGLSDRVLVIRKGEIVADLSDSDINDEKIMTYASGI